MHILNFIELRCLWHLKQNCRERTYLTFSNVSLDFVWMASDSSKLWSPNFIHKSQYCTLVTVSIFENPTKLLRRFTHFEYQAQRLHFQYIINNYYWQFKIFAVTCDFETNISHFVSTKHLKNWALWVRLSQLQNFTPDLCKDIFI